MSARRRFLSLWFASVLVCASVVFASSELGATSNQRAEKISIPGIRDAGKINDYLYRGAQPKESALKELKQLGITTIVDLRGERHGLMETERKNAQALGMEVVNLPGNGWSPPTDQQIAQFFEIMQTTPRRKVFLHCWLGGDRAGIFIAAYRMAFERWTPEQALQEMHEFHFHGFWHPAMAKYVQEFPERLASSPALAVFRHAATVANSAQTDEARPVGPTTP
ncbi:MAG TPA: protein tyrosine phosphatase family protein [Candidatus Sulfotelmatobacter sp.]|nr:protein tyrosine phosphatase family protein [Candidatus Sulfotelmatobacter sp.]